MSSGTNLGFDTSQLPAVIKSVVEKGNSIQSDVQTSFATFVTNSNQDWYAVNAKKFFKDVAAYVDDLNVDIADTVDSFVASLNSAGSGWNKVTGNEFSKVEDVTEYIEGAADKVDEYQDNLENQVYMTESCEANVLANFEVFASDVKAKIEELKTLFNKGELIGGDQSEGFMNVVGQIATKFETAIGEQKAELTTALQESRKAYVDFANKIATTTMSED